MSVQVLFTVPINWAAFSYSHLKVVFDSLQVEALGDDYHPPLGIEAQSHLGTALVVLFPDGYEHLILQQGRAFQIHPENR